MTIPSDEQMVIVLDFGSQYNQLIARRIRENKVYCEILPYNTAASEISLLSPKGIFLSGNRARSEGMIEAENIPWRIVFFDFFNIHST